MGTTESAGGGRVDTGTGSTMGKCVGLQYLPTVGAVLQTQGLRKGVQYPARPLRGEWWGPQDPLAVLQARDICPCAQGGGQRRLLPGQ